MRMMGWMKSSMDRLIRFRSMMSTSSLLKNHAWLSREFRGSHRSGTRWETILLGSRSSSNAADLAKSRSVWTQLPVFCCWSTIRTSRKIKSCWSISLTMSMQRMCMWGTTLKTRTVGRSSLISGLFWKMRMRIIWLWSFCLSSTLSCQRCSQMWLLRRWVIRSIRTIISTSLISFWKLTADKNVQFADPICIFNMIWFLDSQTPAVRLASKSWLAGTTGYLRWVLDPILNVLLEETTIAEKGVNNELCFQTEYESWLVIHAF